MALKLAVIAGDGVGPEVVGSALKVLEAAAGPHNLNYTTTDLDYGGARYLKTGEVISDDEVAALRDYDAIFLGAVGHSDVKPGVLEKGLLLKLRFELDQYINLRPVKLYEGVPTPLAGKGPKDIDFVCVRENTEDLYCGNGGIARKGTAQEISTQEMITTRFGVERCLRYAYNLARERKAAGYPGQLTLVHKTNVLTYAGDTWFRAFEEIGKADFPEIERVYHHVDACCMYMVASPERYDTIVVPNMFGDIITDLGAAIAGGMSIAASGNLNPDGVAPSMFEPVHGSAPDIAGQNKANPLATILSLSVLLIETGRIKNDPAATKVGQQLEQAIRKVCPQFEGQRLDRPKWSTDEITQMVIDAL
ncbi:3-isopropylmalate dehydrogenase [Phycisphaerales bacterium AB-hyl4]|uniref:3-isopropylmalate dehydrogenase n=1 Tax=Natronomicrosphaera hydrolytica TaxID=3242702 RepID=A0ABV4U3X7_9BACT